jgi:4-alpha-glucanotransferase
VIGDPAHRSVVREALERLDMRRLVLGIHDLSFPSAEEEDTGRGAPCSETGLDLLRFVRSLGFDGIQLGPSGETQDGSPSPYEGAVFSRNTLSISLARLVECSDPWSGLLAPNALAEAVGQRPEQSDARVPHSYVGRVHRRLLREAFAAFETRGRKELRRAFQDWKCRHAEWLERDALYDALRNEHEGAPWEEWSGLGSALDSRLWNPRPGEAAACERRRKELRSRHAAEMESYRFAQFLAHEQHRCLREEVGRLGLRLYGDLQAGLSRRDAWSYDALFLRGYVMGAPPSSSNPDGQAWEYPVLDPAQYGELANPGPAMRLVLSRVDKMFAEYDAVRIDHPHGLVCPWVYRPEKSNPALAAMDGARLFSSPDLPDHPALARFAIARRAQLNPDRSTPRHADQWVVALKAEQVDRYALLFDAVVASAHRAGRATSDLVCEVLSTMPYPLGRVLERHGLGRFRVTQKADPGRPDNVYRSENAAPKDWLMVGNHDTKPLWLRIEEWVASGEIHERAVYLAERLVREPPRRAGFAERLARDPGLLVQAQFADLFASPARNVMIFFTDLFGIADVYNRPGVISDENWSLRLPRDYRQQYLERLPQRRAVNLPRALLLALRARGEPRANADLLRRLEEEADALERKSRTLGREQGTRLA